MKVFRWSTSLLLLSFAFALILAGTTVSAQEVVVTPLHQDGIYHVGEKIQWTLDLRGPEASNVKQADYVLKQGGLTVIKKDVLEFSNGKGVVQATLDQPGTILGELDIKSSGKPVQTLFGAVVDPEKIQRSAPPPEDFDAFWAAKIAELNAIPANPQLDPVDAGKADIEYFEIRMDNIHGSHIYGQIAKPRREGKFPALLLVQYAGVYGLPKNNVVNRAAQGWIALNIMAHDLPFDKPEEFYKKAAETTLKDYITIGDDDRDQSYFLRMYLACYRAVEYLSDRPDWDGKTLVVMGTSQGGQQSIITAGLQPRITAMLANVPAGCDVTAPKVGRAAGFPYWANSAQWKKNDKILETGRYFDAVNFASRIKCPILVGTGLIDQSCPPAGVLTAVNQMQGPKEVLVLVNSDHHGHNNAQARYFKRSEQWLAALVKGESVPPK